jgi:beta-xylosidase
MSRRKVKSLTCGRPTPGIIDRHCEIRAFINNVDMPINPIIPGFAPDPSICLVEETYFLVNSSFHLLPGLPIYTSTNLTEWKLLGTTPNTIPDD